MKCDIPDELWTRLQRYAAEEYTTTTEVIIYAITQWLNENERSFDRE